MAWRHVCKTCDHQSSCLKTRKTQQRKRRRATHIYIYIYASYFSRFHHTGHWISLYLTSFISWCLVYISPRVSEYCCISWLLLLAFSSWTSFWCTPHTPWKTAGSFPLLPELTTFKNRFLSVSISAVPQRGAAKQQGDERFINFVEVILSMFGIKARIADCPLIAPSRSFPLPTASELIRHVCENTTYRTSKLLLATRMFRTKSSWYC